MRRLIRGSVLLCGALMMAGLGLNRAAQAQISSIDVAATYDLERAKIASTANCNCFWLQGASAEGAATFYKNVGLVANLSGGHASNITTGVDLSKIMYLFGPRYTYNTAHWTDRYTGRRSTRIFGEGLFGGAHAFNSAFPATTGFTTSASSFAMQIGGGADIALSKGFGVRVLELDYVRTTLPNNASNTQNDFRIAFGVTYHIGK